MDGFHGAGAGKDLGNLRASDVEGRCGASNVTPDTHICPLIPSHKTGKKSYLAWNKKHFPLWVQFLCSLMAPQRLYRIPLNQLLATTLNEFQPPPQPPLCHLPTLKDAEGKQHEKAERLRFGRFYYRFPNGESGADVYDRITIFEDHMIRDVNAGR